jgi:Flp pilus assembly protein TadG
MNASLLKRFMADERGVATIESLLWFPLFVFLLVLITDVSFIFYGKAQALRIMQDGNRAFSVGRPGVTTTGETQTYIRNRLLGLDPDPGVTTTFDGSTGLIQTTVSLNASELMAVGFIPGFGDFEFEMVAQHYKE